MPFFLISFAPESIFFTSDNFESSGVAGGLTTSCFKLLVIVLSVLSALRLQLAAIWDLLPLLSTCCLLASAGPSDKDNGFNEFRAVLPENVSELRRRRFKYSSRVAGFSACSTLTLPPYA